jgi:hypothetical protein
MKIQLISDLHLEHYPDFMPVAGECVDALVLAGDIGSYQAGSKLLTDDFGLGRFSPRAPNAPWRRVFYLPGNHEFDGADFDSTYARLRNICDALSIEWLEREVITIDSVRLVGCTLWADFEAYAVSEPTPSAQLRAREKAYRAANYYLQKNTTTRNGQPVLAEGLRELALDCQEWLRNALSEPFSGSTVVVTHFAPTLSSRDPRYGNTPGTAGFCNALDDLLPLANCWMHGHLHCHHDYTVKGTAQGRPYSCRIVANPRGYSKKGEQKDFIEKLVVEVP